MAKSSKLVALKRGRILLVRRRRDRLWMFPGGRKRPRESEKGCFRREIKEELPKLKLGRVRILERGKRTNRYSGRKMSDAIFVAKKASGQLTIGDQREIDRPLGGSPTAFDLRPRRATSGTNSFSSDSAVAASSADWRCLLITRWALIQSSCATRNDRCSGKTSCFRHRSS